MEGLSMSCLGRMNVFIDIIEPIIKKDKEGFSREVDKIVASVRAYKEDRHGSTKWVNMASFSESSTLFSFRKIPGINVDTYHVIVCDTRRYKITSVEDVGGRGMYIEVLADKVVAKDEKHSF